LKDDLDLDLFELKLCGFMKYIYKSVKFDSNPFNNTEVMAETQNIAI